MPRDYEDHGSYEEPPPPPAAVPRQRTPSNRGLAQLLVVALVALIAIYFWLPAKPNPETVASLNVSAPTALATSVPVPAAQPIDQSPSRSNAGAIQTELEEKLGKLNAVNAALARQHTKDKEEIARLNSLLAAEPAERSEPQKSEVVASRLWPPPPASRLWPPPQ
jgi:hypothetical protein